MPHACENSGSDRSRKFDVFGAATSGSGPLSIVHMLTGRATH
jgi:hypothetical protein